MTDALALSAAVLAVIVQILLLLLVVTWIASRVFTPARRLLDAIRETLYGFEAWIAWIFALTATLGSLYFSEIANFGPCVLCWYQRICMYPLAVILFVMAARRDSGGFWYALPFPIVGIAIGLYHEYITYNPEAESAACRKGISCTVKWIDEFGYITMPTLALTCFAAILALLLIGRSNSRGDAGEALRQGAGDPA